MSPRIISSDYLFIALRLSTVKCPSTAALGYAGEPVTLPSLLLAAAAPPFLSEVVALLLAAAVIAYLCFRLGLVPIVGFLVAGVVIGPNALGLVASPELIDQAAEVGVILLLFMIGIEFSLEKLARIQKLIFVGGGLQVVLATLATAGLLALFGVGWRAGVFTGFLVALSSTAIVLKLLGDRGETNTEHGQVALGLLIFQDLGIIVMVLLVPVLAGTGGGSPWPIAAALGKAAVLIVLILTFARKLMPPVLERVARTCSPEIFLLTVVAICFGTAYLTSLAGVSVSLGAFLAGLLVSESEFSHYAFTEILPLRTLFAATFFVSVGMLLDLGFLMSHLPLVLATLAVLFVVKVATTGVAALALGYGLPAVVTSALVLAQVGEFSFVLERAGRASGLHPAGMDDVGSQTFIAATVVLMVLTPFLMTAGNALAKRRPSAATTEPAPAPDVDRQGHVIVAGYGHSARRLVRALAGAGVPYVITTLSPDGAAEADAEGRPVIRSDASRVSTLESAGLDEARLLVVPDDEPTMAHRITAVARGARPDLPIVVRTRFAAAAQELAEAGATAVVTEELESSLRLADRVLKLCGVAPPEIKRWTLALRSDDRETVPSLWRGGRAVPLDQVVELAAAVAPERCAHAGAVRAVRPSAPGCEECLADGHGWVHLRICMTCGHVGCCDDSDGKHATAHFRATGHPIVRSLEPGESWGWCYEDEVEL